MTDINSNMMLFLATFFMAIFSAKVRTYILPNWCYILVGLFASSSRQFLEVNTTDFLSLSFSFPHSIYLSIYLYIYLFVFYFFTYLLISSLRSPFTSHSLYPPPLPPPSHLPSPPFHPLILHPFHPPLSSPNLPSPPFYPPLLPFPPSLNPFRSAPGSKRQSVFIFEGNDVIPSGNSVAAPIAMELKQTLSLRIESASNSGVKTCDSVGEEKGM